MAVSSGHRAHHRGGTRRRNGKRKHQRHIASIVTANDGDTLSQRREIARRYAQHCDQEMRRQIRDILLEAKPKIHGRRRKPTPHQLDGIRPRNCCRARQERCRQAKAQRKPRRGRHRPRRLGPFRRTARRRPARAAETGTRTTARAKRCSGAGIAASTPTPIGLPPSSSATGPTSGTANGSTATHRTYTAPTGWREQPSGSETQQPRLGLELSVFKPEGTATIRPGGRVRAQGRTAVPKRRPKTPK